MREDIPARRTDRVPAPEVSPQRDESPFYTLPEDSFPPHIPLPDTRYLPAKARPQSAEMRDNSASLRFPTHEPLPPGISRFSLLPISGPGVRLRPDRLWRIRLCRFPLTGSIFPDVCLSSPPPCSVIVNLAWNCKAEQPSCEMNLCRRCCR